ADRRGGAAAELPAAGDELGGTVGVPAGPAPAAAGRRGGAGRGLAADRARHRHRAAGPGVGPEGGGRVNLAGRPSGRGAGPTPWLSPPAGGAPADTAVPCRLPTSLGWGATRPRRPPSRPRR